MPEQTCAAQYGWVFATKFNPSRWASVSPVVALAIGFGSLGLFSSVARGQAPVVNQPLVPDTIAPGGPQLNLTVNGTGFVAGSVVNWNGGALTTQFVSSSQLTATVPAEEIATAGTASITVVNPASGGGTSNVAFFTVATPPASLLFGPAYSLTSNSPTSVAAGDFNGNGKLDLAVASFSNRTVSILHGNGDGTFQSAVVYGVGFITGPPVTATGPTLLVIGDLNGNGKIDLATYVPPARDVAASIWALLDDQTVVTGLPPSAFELGGAQPMAAYGGSLAVGGFEFGFGFGPSGNTVSICSVQGTTFPYFLCGSPSTVAIDLGYFVAGDFNDDGFLDLAVANPSENTVSILLGDSAGNFTLGSITATGLNPSSIGVGDFNGDGKLDLAVVNSGSSTVSILLGDGAGSFTLASSPTTGLDPVSLALGDFNSDGNLDLAVVNNQSNTVSVLVGDGTGNFALAASHATGLNPVSVAVGDFNSDGRLDLAVGNSGDNTVSILLQGTGPAVTLSATALSLGAQDVGTASAAHTLMLTNSGDTMLGISGVTISPASFSETNTCGPTLAPGASCTIAVTFSPSAAGTVSGTLSIADTALGSPHNVALSGVGQDFTIGSYDLTRTVSAGLTAEYNLLVRPLGGFNQAVALTCSGAPQQASCSVTPTSTTLDGRNAAAAVLRVTTTAPASVLPTGDRPLSAPSGWVLALLGSILLLTLLASAVRNRLTFDFARRLRLLTPLAAAALIVLLWIACGGGGPPPVTGGTPSGEYRITVTATSAHLSHAVTVQMTVR